MLTLASVQVRPSAEQRAEFDRGTASVASADAGNEGEALVALIGQVIVTLPVPHLQPSPAQLEALIGNMINAQAQF